MASSRQIRPWVNPQGGALGLWVNLIAKLFLRITGCSSLETSHVTEGVFAWAHG